MSAEYNKEVWGWVIRKKHIFMAALVAERWSLMHDYFIVDVMYDR